MYKFTNGVVVYTIEDRDAFLRAGYVLEEDKENAKEKDSDRIINKEPERSGKATKGFRR